MVLLKSVDSVSGRWEAVNGIGFEELAHGGVACRAGTSGRGMRFEPALYFN
jgi:hypothetical protein